MQQKSRMNCLTLKNKEKKIMENKNYEFKAYDRKGNEIKLQNNVVYVCTKDKALAIKLGIMIGLQSKYKDPQVTFREI